MSIRLIVEDGPLAGQAFDLGSGSHAIGRHGADVAILQDRYLDDDHATIEVGADGVMVRDLNSIHGTFLNGHRIAAAPLHDGDVLQVGTTRLRLVDQAPAGGLLCPGCGLGLSATPPAVCPRCGRDLAPLVRGDVAAGAPAAVFCIACGRKMPPNARFCPGCGHDNAAQPLPAAVVHPSATRMPGWMIAIIAATLVILVIALTTGGYLVGRLAKAQAQAHRQSAELPQDTAEPAAEMVAGVPTAPASAAPAASPELPAYDGRPATAGNWRETGRVRLRYGGQPGQRLRYAANTKVSGGIQVLGESMPLDVDARSGYTQDILANDGNQLSMRLTLEPWGAQQNGSPFSGALPGAPPPLTIRMSPTGEVLGVQSSGAAETAIPKGLPSGLTFDYQTIIQQLSAMSFPDRELAVGDRWSRTAVVPLPNGGQITLNSESRLDGFTRIAGRDVARVITDLSTPVTMSIAGPDGQPVQTVGELSGQVTSLFDPDEGALVRSDSEMAMRMTMESKLSVGGADLGSAMQSLQNLYNLDTEGSGQAPAMPRMPNVADTVKLEATGTVRTSVTREQ